MEPLTIPATLEALPQLMEYVNEAAALAALDDRASYRLCLAVDEIATNIITYGYDAAGESGNLTVWIKISQAQLEVHLQDTARKFDPREVPPPQDLSLPLEQREAGGLGIFLALWGVDDFEYTCTPKRNHTLFIMHRDQR